MVARLPELLFSGTPGKTVLAISLWADESEAKSKRHHFLCIAGYVSSANRWQRFRREWLRMNLPQPFHMVAFRNPQSKLRKELGNSKDIERLAERIARIIRDNTIQGLAVTINPDTYEVLTTQRFRSQYGSAYAFAGMMLWEVLRVWAEDTRYRGKFNFWLQEGHAHADELMQKIWAHKHNTNPLQNIIGDFGFGSKAEHPPLQAADALAYSVYETCMGLKRIPVIELGKISRLHCSDRFIKDRIAEIKKHRESGLTERRAMNAVERDARLAIKQQLEFVDKDEAGNGEPSV